MMPACTSSLLYNLSYTDRKAIPYRTSRLLASQSNVAATGFHAMSIPNLQDLDRGGSVMSKKCKSDNGVSQKNCGSILLSVYLSGIQHLEFTPLSKVKGSATDVLAQLQGIHDRRLVKPHD